MLSGTFYYLQNFQVFLRAPVLGFYKAPGGCGEGSSQPLLIYYSIEIISCLLKWAKKQVNLLGFSVKGKSPICCLEVLPLFFMRFFEIKLFIKVVANVI